MNSVASSIKAPIFVKQMAGAGGVMTSYANINDIANLKQIKDNYWEAESINGTNIYGGKALEYTALIFPSQQKALNFNTAAIDSFLWEKDGYSRPESYAAMFGIEGEGIYALLWSFEDNVRCECTKRDDPVYTDSCLELFLMPVQGDNRYINFEVNPKGIYLSQIGTCRNDRVFIKELTDLSVEKSLAFFGILWYALCCRVRGKARKNKPNP
jgi:hypothetical protein